ncbi:alcohol dehydrogenase catalytic domain-containing protein [Salinicola sp. CPA57]|uniref:alcohol dehydrogenase catalytic domain-containing protein n=1 Tax=Salinicola sp. CPA57 TaxID=1949080 RepID=UPI000DA14513|nr:alcohol dehydrogenase catalytic domain-containing protein [Salinicola sp. CPA57]
MNTIAQRHPSAAVSAGTTYRAAVIPGADRPVEIRSFPIIAAGPGEVIMRTLLSEVCGTDVHIQNGHLDGVPYPIIPGHFSVGVVDEANGDVRAVDGRPVRKGDVITFLDVHETCHKCWECQVAKTPWPRTDTCSSGG